MTHDPYYVEPRKPLTPKQRMKLFLEREGKCCVCGGKIAVSEAWIDEHINPLSRTGTNDQHNRGVAHIKCARAKTAQEATERSKGRRLAEKHFGAGKTRKGKPMAGTKASGWKKRMDGTVVKRGK